MREKLTSDIKQKLILKTLERNLKKSISISESEKSGGVVRSNVTELTDFAKHPGYLQIAMVRDVGDKLNLPSPFFKVHDSTAGATTQIEGESYINFASYNYLGLCGHPLVNEAAINAIDRYGTSVSASRMVSGERPIHQQLESELANAYDVDDAVVFVSGHATNVSVVGYLLGPKDLILHDEFIHNSVLVGSQLSGARRISFRHNRFEELAVLLEQHRNNFERVLIVVEGLYSMDGDYPDLPRCIELKEHFKAWLMVDESHSFGVMGNAGLGIRDHFGLSGDAVDIWMGTLSKALSASGGYIAGCQELVDILRHLAPGFLYSVGIPGQVAAPALAALKLMQNEPDRVKRLHEISTYFLEQVQRIGLDAGYSKGIAVVPVILGSSLKAVQLSNYLFKQGINIQPIIYPAVPEKSARLRFFLSSEHTREQIDWVILQLSSASDSK
jgi:8-amino-7-oxononanoate synthase